MSLKIDVHQIVTDHFRTLVNLSSDRTSVLDVTLFYAMPLVVALLLVRARLLLNDAAVGILVTALAIFTGLLFNLLLLAHGIIRNTSDAPAGSPEKRLLREIYVNIAYSILVGLIALMALLIEVVWRNGIVEIAVSLTTYFLIGNFLLTLLMVLKRIHVLLRREFA